MCVGGGGGTKVRGLGFCWGKIEGGGLSVREKLRGWGHGSLSWGAVVCVCV